MNEQIQDILCRILESHQNKVFPKPYPGDWREAILANAMIIVRDHYRNVYDEVIEHLRLNRYPDPIIQREEPLKLGTSLREIPLKEENRVDTKNRTDEGKGRRSE